MHYKNAVCQFQKSQRLFLPVKNTGLTKSLHHLILHIFLQSRYLLHLHTFLLRFLLLTKVRLPAQIIFFIITSFLNVTFCDHEHTVKNQSDILIRSGRAAFLTAFLHSVCKLFFVTNKMVSR